MNEETKELTITALSQLTLDQIDQMIKILEKIKKNRLTIEQVIANPTKSGIKRLLCGWLG